MDADEFRIRGKEMVDYIADYLENIRDRRVYPDVAPGYLHKLLPETAPETGESWQDIFKDVDRAIMPGVLNWQSPHMHAYFPALTSYPSILGEMLASGLNNLTFTWASSPAGTELETIAMNWLGKMIGLPDVFLNVSNESLGGGVIQTTASEATLVSLLAARTRSLLELAELNPEVEPAELSGHLIAYCSDQAHSSVEKAGLIGLVRMRYIESDNNQCMRGPKLEEAILKDKEKGMVPFWVCATLGTTGSVAFDNLEEVSQVCQRHGAWLHCDAAYAGSAFICPEYRHWLKGVENADSLAFNPSKWLMVNFDCTAMWVKHSKALHRTFNVNPIYLRHENSGKAIDYMLGIKSRKPQIKKRYLISRHPLSVSVKQTAIPTEKDTTKLGSRDPENLDSKLKNYEKTSSDSDYDSNSSNFDSISNIELNNDIYNRRDDSETQIVEKCERNHVENRYFDLETDSDETPVDQCRRIEIIAKELPPLGSQNKTQSFLNTSENEEDVCTLLTEMLNSKVDIQHKDAPYIQKEVMDKEVNYERNKDTSDLYFKPRSHSKYIKLEDSTKTEFSHWQIPLSRRFRALKLWFVLRSYGVAGLQKHIRESVRLAQKFEALVLADTRFEIPQPRNLGMVVFRLKGDNTLTECLLKRLNARGNIHCVPAIFKSVYVIRFTVTSQMTTNQDIIDDWAEIRLVASCILKEIYGCESGNIFLPKKPRVTLKETKDMNKTFGTSLLLANSPMSPKIVNGTYAAIRDYEQVLNSCAHTFSILKMEPKDSPEMRRRIRGIKMVGKKFSLDSCLDMVQGLVAASEEKNVQTLPLMREDEREDLVSNGSSPIDFSSQIPSPNSACADGHHLFVQPPATRQYRSKSVDITLSGLANNESASVTFDMAKNKIIITPTKDEQTKSDKTANLIKDEAFCADSSSGDEEKANIDKNVNLENDKITIIGPGSYIKKIIQQFSENSFDCDPEMAKRGENSESLTKSPSFRERADALCKKCLHFKGKVNK